MQLFAEAAPAPIAATIKPVLPMIVLGSIMTLTYVAIAFDWLNKSLAAMLGALLCVGFALAMGVFKDEAGHSAYDRAVHDIIGHDIGASASSSERPYSSKSPADPGCSTSLRSKS